MGNKFIEVTAIYDKDLKQYHRFVIDEDQGIAGTIYVLKDARVPESLMVHLKSTGEWNEVSR